MQRLMMSILSLAAFAPAAYAQTAPDPAQPAAAPDAAPTTAPVTTAAPAEAVPPATEPTPPPAVVEPKPSEVKADKPAEPKKLAVGKETPGAFFTPGLLLQGWYVQDFGSSLKDANGDTTTLTTLSTFRLRRAEISANGELIPKFMKYRVMFDPARVRDTLNRTTAAAPGGTGTVVVSTPASSLSPLQDFYITFQSEYADVSLGQFKIPVSWEGVNSSSKLLLPERAFTSTVFGDKRDLGIRVEKTFEKFGYMAGVFNGAGQNNFDNNVQKDLALRLEVYPIKGMTIAGVTYDSVGYRKRAGTKDRWEADFRYETGPFLVQAEYIRAQDITASGATACKNVVGKCTGQGAYGALAYTIKDLGTGNWKGNLQPVVRVGFYDPDVDNEVDAMNLAENSRVDYEVGLNYYLRNNEVKIQASYDRQQFEDTDLKAAINEVILSTQLSF
jgi:hypothetical protein